MTSIARTASEQTLSPQNFFIKVLPQPNKDDLLNTDNINLRMWGDQFFIINKYYNS